MNLRIFFATHFAVFFSFWASGPVLASSAVAGVGLSSASQAASFQQEMVSPNAPLILAGAWLIDGTGAAVKENGWIHIRDGHIVAVGQGTPPSDPGARVIDLKGKTVLPGLSDMHAHLGTLDRARWILKLLLAYGVTTVRDTGNELGNLSAIRRDLEGRQVMPKLYYGGPMMNGNFSERRFLREGTGLQMLLEDITAFGVSFLKHHHWVTTAAVRQIARHADEHGLYVVGHVPMTMTSVAALDSGIRVLEHIRMLPSEVLDDPEVIARHPIDAPFMRRKGYWAHFDPKGRAVRRTLDAWEKRKDKFFIDPTLVVEEITANRYDPNLPEDPDLRLVSPGTLKRWKNTPPTRWGDLNEKEIAEAKASADGMKAFIGMAHSRGVRILTGSDLLMAGVVPGPSLHREFQILVEAGLSPVEVIHCSTGLAAQALRVSDRGTIAPGQVADLVIVRGDLASDMTVIGQIEQVMLAGSLHQRGQLLEEALRLAMTQKEPNEFHPF
jgi:hypothetical protein